MAFVFESALVTGGAGFIGSHLTQALAAGGCQVTVLDDLSSGHASNLEAVASRIRFMHGSICDRRLVEEAAADCEAVFHLAAVVSVPRTTADPLGSASVNEIGSLNVLEAARRARARRFVFASSSAVYGDDPVLPKREDMAPRPMTPYAVQKLAAEYHARVYTDLYGLATVCLRFFNVYGPSQDPSSPYSGVISIFMTKALEGEGPVIYGDGAQSRDFVFVQDVVQALLLAAQTPSACGMIFNVGTGCAISVNELWENVARLAGTSAAPAAGAARPGDIRHSVACIDQARNRLGYAPRQSLAEGLATTFAWYRQSRGKTG